jgi:bacterioferritin-associated ferredoxin
MVVCHCLAVNDRTIRSEILAGALDASDVAARCGAGGRCGGCVEVIESLVAEVALPVPALAGSTGR